MTIDGGAGDDTIINGGSNVLIKYSGGNDLISGLNSTSTLQIASGEISSVMKFLDNNDFCVAVGNDTITLSGVENEINLVDAEGKKINYTLHIVGTENDDYIYSGYGANIFIHGEAGNDSAENIYSYVSIDGGKGNDNITNYGEKVSILGGENDDYIWNGQSDYYPTKGDKASIDAGAGNDSVINYGASVSIEGGEDDDTLESYSDNVTIIGGTGADSILNSGGKVSIIGSTGNNTLHNGKFEVHTEEVTSGYVHGVPMHKDILVAGESLLGGSNVTITADKDNDVIQNFGGSKVTIDAGDGNNQVSLVGSGKNISVKAGGGNDSIFAPSFAEDIHFNQEAYTIGNGSNVTIEAGDGENLVSVGSSWSYVTIKGGLNNDSIISSGSNVSIAAGNGNNFVSVVSGKGKVTINGGNKAEELDVINNASKQAVITGNAGIDAIENSGDKVTILGGEDRDLLTNYGNNVYIEGDNGKSKRSSADYIITDKGNDVTINGGKDDDIIDVYHDVRASVSGGAGNDRIFLNRVSADDSKTLLKDLFTDVGNAILGLAGAPFALTASAIDWLTAVSGSLFGEKKIPYIGKAGNWITAASGAVAILSRMQSGSLLNQLNKTESTVNGGKGDDTIVADGFGAAGG